MIQRLMAAAALAAMMAACSPPAQETPVPIETATPGVEAPSEVLAVIQAEAPSFAPTSVVENNMTGAQTYEVTGTTAEGERTYNVMHFNEGWRIVQVRRTLSWGDAPQAVRDVVATSPQAIVPDAVVEVREPGADGVHYELWSGSPPAVALTVREANGQAAIMPAPH